MILFRWNLMLSLRTSSGPCSRRPSTQFGTCQRGSRYGSGSEVTSNSYFAQQITFSDPGTDIRDRVDRAACRSSCAQVPPRFRSELLLNTPQSARVDPSQA